MIESILQQAPEGVDVERVKELYEKHQGNVVSVLTELWNIPEKDVHNVSYNSKQAKWNEVRDICNAYEEEMEKFMQNIKTNNKII